MSKDTEIGTTKTTIGSTVSPDYIQGAPDKMGLIGSFPMEQTRRGNHVHSR